MWRFRCLLLIAAFFAALTAVSPAEGTTIVIPSDDELIAKSPLIVVGTVLRSEARRQGDAIRTETELAVTETLKGFSGLSVIISEAGGVAGDRAVVVFGSPRYRTGESVLAFLWPRRDGTYQTRDLFIGKFTEHRTVSGDRVWARDETLPATRLVDRALAPVAPDDRLRDAERFTQYIRDVARGGNPLRDYAMACAPLAPERLVAPKFALIDAPPVYRWFAFDNDETVEWNRVGLQQGYDGGGEAEVTLGLVAWTQPGTSGIRFAYRGESNEAPGGLSSANGRNEVILGDVLGEIDGSWTAGGSGVVGRGGFSAARLYGSWIAPFDGGGGLHEGLWSDVWEILEGNLVIQDGVSPQAGIRSGVLAEIVAHEFGHTLGFGHSDDASALMYPTITASGPALRSDDELAARWLYPRTASPRPPSPPAALRATSGSEGVLLTWIDSASDETGFVVYVAPDAKSFSRAIQLPADSTTAQLQGLLGGLGYRAYVVSANAAGESSPSNIVGFTAPNPQPLFIVSPEAGTAGETIFTFQDLTPNGVSRVWEFGDGMTSDDSVATHVYASAGTYEVVLRVTLQNGIEIVATRVVYVNAPDNPLFAAFSVSPDVPLVGQPVTFRDTSTGPVSTRLWHFGEGSTSTEPVVVRAFDEVGTYRVILTVSDGERIATTARDVVVVPPPPFRSVIPVTASTSGLGGSLWMTEVIIHNHGLEPASVRMTLVPAAGGIMRNATVSIGADSTLVYDNLMEDLFSTPAGAGALLIESFGVKRTPALKVISRTYSASSEGSVNQVVPDDAITGPPGTRFIAGIPRPAEFRTNFGFVNLDTAEHPVTLALLDEGGVEIDRVTIGLSPLSFRQLASADLFRNFARSPSLTHAIAMDADPAVHAYASIVDNQSHDAVFVPAASAPSGVESWIPVVANTKGATGELWQSDLTLFNPADTAAVIDLALIGVGGDSAVAPLTIGPRATISIPEVVTYLGFSSARGAIRIRTEEGVQHPIVRARAYTQRAPGRGSVGQSIAAAPSTAFGSFFVVAGLPYGNGWRANLGMVNRSAESRSVQARLIDPAGRIVAEETIVLPPTSHWQAPVRETFPTIVDDGQGRYTIDVNAPGGEIFVYGSYVDNASGDPVYVAAE